MKCNIGSYDIKVNDFIKFTMKSINYDASSISTMATNNITNNVIDTNNSTNNNKLMPILGWGLDPLVTCNRKLFVQTIRRNCSYDNDDNKGAFRFYYYNRPILKVEVVGILISKRIQTTTKGTKVYLWVDDGSGVIMCMQPIDVNKPYYQTVFIGCLLSVKGTLILLETNDNPYGWVIRIQAIDIFDDPNAEALYWASSLLLHETDYKKPYQISKHNIDSIGLNSYHEILQYCTCCNSLSSSSSSSQRKKYKHLKEKLLYCKCLATHSHPDPNCDFRYHHYHDYHQRIHYHNQDFFLALFVKS